MRVVPDFTYEFPDNVFVDNLYPFLVTEDHNLIIEGEKRLKYFQISYHVRQIGAVKYKLNQKNDCVTTSQVTVWVIFTNGKPVFQKRDAHNQRKNSWPKWNLYHLCPERMNLPCECCPKRTEGSGCLTYRFKIKPKLEEIERKRKQRHSKSSNEE